MSTLETNAIGKYSGNNVSVDDALNLKSYTTTQRDALTSVAGDTIYNSTTNKPQYYDGSAWQDMAGAGFDTSFLVIAGGGGGGGHNDAGGGGAGGYRNSYASETSGGGNTTEEVFKTLKSTNYTVTVGAGGTGVGNSTYMGLRGNDSLYGNVVSVGGGGGRSAYASSGASSGQVGGSGGGNSFDGTATGNAGVTNQGFAGGVGRTLSPYELGS